MLEGIRVLRAGLFARPIGIIPVISAQGTAYLVAGVVMTVWLRGGRAVVSPGRPLVTAGAALASGQPGPDVAPPYC
jgi:hypothetical protein